MDGNICPQKGILQNTIMWKYKQNAVEQTAENAEGPSKYYY